jgi:hypothetical protein
MCSSVRWIHNDVELYIWKKGLKILFLKYIIMVIFTADEARDCCIHKRVYFDKGENKL